MVSIEEKMMRAAIERAQFAKALGEVPVGAVIARGEVIVASGHNMTEVAKDPTAHAEIVAIRAACRALGDWRLNGLTLYVTLEPCPMCAGAIVQARIERVVFGAYDAKYGCAGSVYRITEDPAFTHFAKADGGVLVEECAQLMRDVWAR